MKLSLQARTVLDHLRTESHLTAMQAQGVYSIRRLASRIDEIVAAGYEVIKEEARDRVGQRYVRYSLSAVQVYTTAPINPTRERAVKEITYTHAQVKAALLKHQHEMVLFGSEIQTILKTLKESA